MKLIDRLISAITTFEAVFLMVIALFALGSLVLFIQLKQIEKAVKEVSID